MIVVSWTLIALLEEHLGLPACRQPKIIIRKKVSYIYVVIDIYFG